MTDYEPGRIYSGIPELADERVVTIHTTDGMFNDGNFAYTPGEFTDVRGPLVVLDLPSYTDVPEMVEELRKQGQVWLGNQIEEQTRPPLQIGWHEVKPTGHRRAIREWDGTTWRHASGARDCFQGWTPTHFIGPASDAS